MGRERAVASPLLEVFEALRDAVINSGFQRECDLAALHPSLEPAAGSDAGLLPNPGRNHHVVLFLTVTVERQPGERDILPEP